MGVSVGIVFIGLTEVGGPTLNVDSTFQGPNGPGFHDFMTYIRM